MLPAAGLVDLTVDKLDAELANEDFDAVAFVNSVLPDSNSLAELPDMMRKLQVRSRRVTASIREAVRSYSVLGDSSDAILADTRNSIVDLSDKIANIHAQATETEEVVSKICEGIKPLDRAKCNLTASVTALRRLKCVVEAISALERNIEENNYQQSAENVIELTALFEFFKQYEKAPQIQPLAGKFFDLKRVLRNKVNTEIESKLFRGSSDSSNLPLCAVIDAYADDFRSNVIDLFCDKFLAPYDEAYQGSPLKDVGKRFQWFKQRIDFYNNQYQEAFPPEWRMQYHLSMLFSKKTASQLASVMDQKPPSIKEYLTAFELVAKFEQKMAESFATTEMVYIDKDAVMPEFENTPEGIRKKVEWRMRKENGIGEQVKRPAKEFIGVIAVAFAPHMSLYLDSEREALAKIIRDAAKNPMGDIDEEGKQMMSVSTLVQNMKAVIDKCTRFNIPGTLLDMFMNLKTLLGQYVESLTKSLPSKMKGDNEYKLLCAITNSSSILLSIIDTLATKVKSLIDDPDIAAGVFVDDTKETISSELRKQLVYATDVVIKEMEGALIQVGNNTWDQSAADGGKVPLKITDTMTARFSVIQRFMSNDNINRMRSTFAQKVVAVMRDSMFRLKQVTTEAASRIGTAEKEVKSLVLYWTKADSTLAKKRIENEFMKFEVEITILCAPEVAIAVTYVAKMQKKSKEHLRSIIRLRSDFSPQKEQELLAEYERQLSEQ